jgi:hypothetical protein
MSAMLLAALAHQPYSYIQRSVYASLAQLDALTHFVSIYLRVCVQVLQATWALRGTTCSAVATQLKNPRVNHSLALALVRDFKAALDAAGWPAAADSVVAVRQPCVTFNVS